MEHAALKVYPPFFFSPFSSHLKKSKARLVPLGCFVSFYGSSESVSSPGNSSSKAGIAQPRLGTAPHRPAAGSQNFAGSITGWDGCEAHHNPSAHKKGLRMRNMGWVGSAVTPDSGGQLIKERDSWGAPCHPAGLTTGDRMARHSIGTPHNPQQASQRGFPVETCMCPEHPSPRGCRSRHRGTQAV